MGRNPGDGRLFFPPDHGPDQLHPGLRDVGHARPHDPCEAAGGRRDEHRRSEARALSLASDRLVRRLLPDNETTRRANGHQLFSVS